MAEHADLMEALALYLASDGYTDIKVDMFHPTWTWPDPIPRDGREGEGHIPDATATKDGAGYLIEVETGNSLDSDDTRNKWELVAADAKQHKKVFAVAVPKASEQKAQRRLQELGLTALVWTIG